METTKASNLCVRNCGSLVDEAAVFGIQAVCNDCRDPNRELTFVWHMFEIDLRTDTSREISDLSSMQVSGPGIGEDPGQGLYDGPFSALII
ncbi:Hypp2683 [Branchiostoma lanceolatum]|uniref:Hypp2683 protein n=1 Tax=Branchiostoma lanceolatum TaxID=7740 RepID=A0A8K0ER93_BRALA|nr:Hypp2683 [Branchiostoma lanceolatum]